MPGYTLVEMVNDALATRAARAVGQLHGAGVRMVDCPSGVRAHALGVPLWQYLLMLATFAEDELAADYRGFSDPQRAKIRGSYATLLSVGTIAEALARLGRQITPEELAELLVLAGQLGADKGHRDALSGNLPKRGRPKGTGINDNAAFRAIDDQVRRGASEAAARDDVAGALASPMTSKASVKKRLGRKRPGQKSS